MNFNIWIFNHYIIPPSVEIGHRHNKFAKYLKKDSYNVTLFFSSFIHNTDFNLIQNNDRYTIDESDHGSYVAVKTRNYKDNGKKRLLNILDYFTRIFSVTKSIGKIYGKPDIILASSVHPLTCVAGILIARRYKVKCIIEIRDLWPLTLIEMDKIKNNSLIARLLYGLEFWIYKKADSIIFTGEGEKRYLVDKKLDEYLDINKTYYINNGVDLDIFKKQSLEEVYEDEDLDSKYFKVVYTGSIRPANDVGTIIEVAEYLSKTKYSDKLLFLIFGEGIEKEELMLYCKNNNIVNIKFKGNVNKKFVPNILSKSNLNLLHYSKKLDLFKYGGSQNKLFEYFASGKPIISTTKMTPDIIAKYKCGITVENFCIENIAEKIIEIYNMNKSDYENLCDNSRKAAYDYDFRTLTLNLEKIIKNTMENNHEHTFD